MPAAKIEVDRLFELGMWLMRVCSVEKLVFFGRNDVGIETEAPEGLIAIFEGEMF